MHSFDNKAKYVFQTFFDTLGIKSQISYGQTKKVNIHIKQGNVDYFNKFIPYNINDLRYFIWKGRKIPILFYTPFNEKTDLFDEFKKTKILPVDIISSSFFFLSCWQEFTTKKCRDIARYVPTSRFPFNQSIQSKLKITDFPIVNEYMNVFRDICVGTTPIRQACGVSLHPHLPDNKKFIVCLTHDIDYIKKWRKENYRQEIKEMLCRDIARYVPTFDYWVFNKICTEEEKRNFRSSFYFLTDEYDIARPHFLRLFKELKKGNWEIGLHSKWLSESFRDSAGNYNNLMQEKKKLENASHTKISGLRYHWLKFNSPDAFGIQESAGIKYDSSLGFAEAPGYRTGFTFPYHPYNIKEDKPFKLWELPLNIMDTSLFYHQKLSLKASWQIIEKFLITTLKYNGWLVILWHEASFDNPNYTKLYTKILDWIETNDGAGISCEQALQYWDATPVLGSWIQGTCIRENR